MLGPYSSWSECSDCMRYKLRKIIQQPKNGGKSCEKRVKAQRCPICAPQNHIRATPHSFKMWDTKHLDEQHKKSYRSQTHKPESREDDDATKLSRQAYLSSNNNNTRHNDLFRTTNSSIKDLSGNELLGSTSFTITINNKS